MTWKILFFGVGKRIQGEVAFNQLIRNEKGR
jgi:hypothetical protein